MNPIDLLWKVLRATTNSPNDVWKPRHYERHKGIPDKLLGQQISRYTVPVQHIVDTKFGSIYLVIQFCTDNLDIPYFAIPSHAFTNNLKVKEEFVYAINIRLCFDYEFKVNHGSKKINQNGEIKLSYRKDILINALGLIRQNPRWKNIVKLKENKNNLLDNKKNLEKIIKVTQFNNDEREYKGLSKNK